MTLAPAERAGIQRRTLWVLAIGQVLSGFAFGATLSLGAVLAAHVSGDDALSGLAAAAITLGAAGFAVPLAAYASRRGRQLALSGGVLIALGGVCVVIVAAFLGMFWLLLAAFALIGAGQAANLQTRFAATDLSTDASRGRDLSTVVWATTVGAVLGPNLVGPGEALGEAWGMPYLTGPYVFTIVAQVLVAVLYLTALKPDPLFLARKLAAGAESSGASPERADRPIAARYAIFAVASAHLVMVAVMAMTPVHLLHHGASVTLIGLTISLHVLGMFGLSPVFGILADRWGRVRTILLGQAVLAASLLVAALGQNSSPAVTLALVLLGIGWSASTVSGAALLTESSAPALRTRRQGRSDLVMNLVAALGAIASGAVLGWIGFGGLALVALIAVAAVVVSSPLGGGSGREARRFIARVSGRGGPAN